MFCYGSKMWEKCSPLNVTYNDNLDAGEKPPNALYPVLKLEAKTKNALYAVPEPEVETSMFVLYTQQQSQGFKWRSHWKSKTIQVSCSKSHSTLSRMGSSGDPAPTWRGEWLRRWSTCLVSPTSRINFQENWYNGLQCYSLKCETRIIFSAFTDTKFAFLQTVHPILLIHISSLYIWDSMA